MRGCSRWNSEGSSSWRTSAASPGFIKWRFAGGLSRSWVPREARRVAPGRVAGRVRRQPRAAPAAGTGASCSQNSSAASSVGRRIGGQSVQVGRGGQGRSRSRSLTPRSRADCPRQAGLPAQRAAGIIRHAGKPSCRGQPLSSNVRLLPSQRPHSAFTQVMRTPQQGDS